MPQAVQEDAGGRAGGSPVGPDRVRGDDVRLHVVSDVHGNGEAPRRAGDGADALLVLGDLIDSSTTATR